MHTTTLVQFTSHRLIENPSNAAALADKAHAQLEIAATYSTMLLKFTLTLLLFT